MKEQPLRNYVVKKYVRARTVAQAMRIANETPVHEVVIDDDAEEEKVNTEAYGFQYTQDEWEEVPDEYCKGMLK